MHQKPHEFDPKQVTLSDVKFDSRSIVTKFNETPNQKNADSIYLKTIINNSVAYFVTAFSASYPAQNIVEQLMALGDTLDQEIYRSVIAAFTIILSQNAVLTNLTALHGLSYVILKNGGKYTLRQDEVNRLLDLVLTRLTYDSHETFEALNNFLDAMLASKRVITSPQKKVQVMSRLKQLEGEEDPVIKYQAARAAQVLDRLESHETPIDEIKRRAMAFVAGVQALVTVGTGVASMISSFGITTAFSGLSLIPAIKEVLDNFQKFLDIDLDKKGWYDKMIQLQAVLAIAAVKLNNNPKEVAQVNELLTTLKVAKEEAKSDILWSLIDGLGNIVLIQTDESLAKEAMNVLERYYSICQKYEQTHPRAVIPSRKQAKRTYQVLASNIIFYLTLAKGCEKDRVKEIEALEGRLKQLDNDFYTSCSQRANERCDQMKYEPLPVAVDLIRLTQRQINIEFDIGTPQGKPTATTFPPLFGDGAVIKKSHITRDVGLIGPTFKLNNVNDLDKVVGTLKERMDNIDKLAQEEIGRPIAGKAVTIEDTTLVLKEFFKNVTVDMKANSNPEDSAFGKAVKFAFEKNWKFTLSRPVRNRLRVEADIANSKPGEMKSIKKSLIEGLQLALADEYLADIKIEEEDSDNEVLNIKAENTELLNRAAEIIREAGGKSVTTIPKNHPVFCASSERGKVEGNNNNNKDDDYKVPSPVQCTFQ